LRWEDERLGRAGARVLRLAGASYRLEALQDDAFAPGSRLELVPEPENEYDPYAIAVWDAERRLQAGYVPAEAARDLRLPLQALSLWEWREGGQRVGLRLLVAPADVWIGRPR
jgi:HIRAN domain